MNRKVTVVGGGNVGATHAQRIADRELADVALVDIVEGIPRPGGSPANVAVALGRQGLTVTLATQLADDEYGALIRPASTPSFAPVCSGSSRSGGR